MCVHVIECNTGQFSCVWRLWGLLVVSYPNSDDSYPSNWLFCTHFGCGGNPFLSTQTTFNCFTCICGGTMSSAEKIIASIELHTSALGTKGCVVTRYCKLQVFGIDVVEIEVGKSKGYILINESIAQGNLIDWWVIDDTSSCVHCKAWVSYEKYNFV